MAAAVRAGGVSCIDCSRRLINRGGRRPVIRSHQLTADFFARHPNVFAYLRNTLGIDALEAEDRICHACFMRIQRAAQEQQPQREHVEIDPPVAVNEQREDVEIDPPVAVNEQREDVEIDPPVAVNEQREHVEIDPPVAVNEQREHVEINPPVAVNEQAVQVNLTFPLSGYSRIPINRHRCLIADCRDQNTHRIDLYIRAAILDNYKIYIPNDARACNEHLRSNIWNDFETHAWRILTYFTPALVTGMLKLQRRSKHIFLDFERLNSISDDIFMFHVGFSKSNFLQIIEETPSISIRFKKPKSALATVLVKLHTGNSNERLSKMFKKSRKTFEKTMKMVRQCLLNEFVPRHLGFNHLSREQLIANSLTIPTNLFGNPEAPLDEQKAIAMLDSTYIYLQKSSNFAFQRKSYSLHKWRNLVKPFLIVCPNGHIVDVLGPYAAVKSDASILINIVNNANHRFHRLFRPGDVFILDRGFRDSIHDMESFGYEVHMPATRNRGESQLNTQQANYSRKVTMTRWVIETVNGRMKNQFRQLSHQYFNKAGRNLFGEVRIAAALLNAFGVPCVDHELVDEILNEFHTRYNMENRLAEYVTEKNLNRLRADFQAIDANLPELDFPFLSQRDLTVYALGSYQLKQARSYYAEHVKPDGSYVIEVYRDTNLQEIQDYGIVATNPWLLRGRIQSRHIGGRIRYTYILVEAGAVDRNAILGHYCSCIIGKRTLGCCSHIMTILWFLGWARHQDSIDLPAAYLEDIIIREDIEIEADEDDFVLAV